MKRAIIFALVAFLISLGGTTAVMVKRGVPTAQVAAAAKADSGAADTGKAHAAADPAKVAKTDSARTKSDSGTKTAHAPRDSAKADTTKPAPEAAAALAARARPTVRPVSTTPAADPAARAAAVKQVARVLSAMKPVEAAKVLAYLSDTEVEQILRAVGPRQAADFMTNLPKERAASLSRRLMVPKESGR